MATLRIAIAQSSASVGDVRANTECVLDLWRTAAGQGAELVLFPELALVGYPPDDLLLRPALIARAEAALARLASEGPRGSTAIVGTIGRSARSGDDDWGVASAVTGLANRAAIVEAGRVVGTYDKMRLPNAGVFDEARYFLPGDATLVHEVSGVRVGTVVCQDLWTVAGPVARSAGDGAQLIAVLNASPYHRGKREEREAWVVHHASTLGVWVCYANRVGGQDEVVFDGDSMVADPSGRIVARGAQFMPDLVLVDIDTADGRSNVPDRRHGPDHALSPLDELWTALVTATRDYCRSNGFTEVVIGLSGGIDSAVTAAIAVDALGEDAVLGVAMPSPYSSSHSVEDALDLARRLDIRVETLPIADPLAAVSGTLGDLVVTGYVGERPAGIAYENLQSRIRGLLLMALSNERGALVLTTGNKSEYAVGYATLYGDMAGGFAPLKDVLKGDVYRLARHVNRDHVRIPESSITKAPSAELRPGQLDADSLPDYESLDAILTGFVEDLGDIDSLVAAGLVRDEVVRVIRLVDRAEHKRRQAAPGPKVSRRAFGRERRVPITSGFDAAEEEQET